MDREDDQFRAACYHISDQQRATAHICVCHVRAVCYWLSWGGGVWGRRGVQADHESGGEEEG